MSKDPKKPLKKGLSFSLRELRLEVEKLDWNTNIAVSQVNRYWQIFSCLSNRERSYSFDRGFTHICFLHNVGKML